MQPIDFRRENSAAWWLMGRFLKQLEAAHACLSLLNGYGSEGRSPPLKQFAIYPALGSFQGF
jgi:hypothetical protein